MSLPAISWTIDGHPVKAAGWGYTAEIGGYHRASLTVPASQARAAGAGQGSVVTAWQSNGRCAYEGVLALRPRYASGMAFLEANGHKAAAEKRHDRLMYQHRDITEWVDATAPPHELAAPTNEMISTTAPANMIRLQAVNPTAGTKTYGAKFALWIPGVTVARYAFSARKAGDWSAGNPDVVMYRGTGPAGTLTSIATHDISTGPNPDQTVTGGEDMLVMEIQGQVPSLGTGQLTIYNLRVNGVDSVLGDTLTTSELVSDIGARLGWDTSGVQATSLDVMPLDLSGAWTDGLDYAMTLDDWQWRVLEDRGNGPYEEYTPWEREHVAYLAKGAHVRDILPIEQFNRVVVWWSDDNGTPHSVSVDADPDPLEGRGIFTYELSIAGRRGDSTLASTVATTILAEVSKERWQGSVELTELDTGTPFDVLPGDLLTLPDWDQGTARQLRIVSTAGAQGGIVAGIAVPAAGASLIGRSALGMFPLMGSARLSRTFPRHYGPKLIPNAVNPGGPNV